MTRLVASLFAACCIAWAQPAGAYGISGHLRAVYENWDTLFQPSLGRKEGRLLFAASAGALVSDIGYAIPRLAPLSNRLHYLDSMGFADTVLKVAREKPYSGDRMLLAFALGLKSHYWADRYGHFYGTNRIVSRLAARNQGQARPVPDRISYEHSQKLHGWVEARAVVFDWRTATNEFAEGARSYVFSFSDFPKFTELATDLLNEALRRHFPGIAFALDVYDFIRYLRFAAEMLCRGLQVVATPDNPRALSLLDVKSCLDSLARLPKIPDHSGPLPFDKLFECAKTPLSPNDKVEERDGEIYNQSHRILWDRLLKTKPASGPEMNLDTNLPAAAGTYYLADITFQAAARQSEAGPASARDPAIEKRNKDFRDRGRAARAVFASPIPDAAAAEGILRSVQLRTYMRDWLSEIHPGVPDRIEVAVEPGCAGFGAAVALPGRGANATDRAVRASDGAICVRKGTRLLDLLYVIAAVRNPGDEAARHYLEALERLRLRDEDQRTIDPATGMYPQGAQWGDPAERKEQPVDCLK